MNIQELKTTGLVTESAKERFLALIDFTSDVMGKQCWLWKGASNTNGYGTFPYLGGNALAHVFAYTMFHGEYPNGYCILHSCDCPKCVNPAHIRAGTKEENTRDAVERGRLKKGEGHHLTKFTDQQVLEIKKLTDEGYSSKDIALRFNCSPSYVSMVAQNRCRKEILEKNNLSAGEYKKVFGENHPKTKHSDEVIEKIRELQKEGCSSKYISFKLGLNNSTVRGIMKNRWRKKMSLPKLTLGDLDNHLTSTSSDVVPVVPT